MEIINEEVNVQFYNIYVILFLNILNRTDILRISYSEHGM